MRLFLAETVTKSRERVSQGVIVEGVRHSSIPVKG